jgi:hypothetical protein
METEILMPSTTTVRRVVVEHRTGPMAGLQEIVGLTTDIGTPVPLYLEFNRLGQQVAFGMVKAKRGGLYFREVVKVEGLKTFNGAQV